MPLSPFPPSDDVGELTHEVRRLFEDIARQRPHSRPFVTGECSPLLDVLETDHSFEIVVDVPGMTADHLRILIKKGVVLVVGEKERVEHALRTPASFHLVERDFGRFARAVRVHTAVDAGRATARLADGELRIALPKIVEQRGREILVPIETADRPTSSSS